MVNANIVMQSNKRTGSGGLGLAKDTPREEELFLETNFTKVATAGTPVKITKIYAGQTITLWSDDGNTGDVYVGNRQVNSTTGYPITINGNLSINLTQGIESHKYFELYLDAANAGDKVYWIKI